MFGFYCQGLYLEVWARSQRPGGNIGLATIGSTKPVPMPMLRSYLFSSVQACIYLYPQPVGQLVAKRVIEECCKQPHVGPIGTELHKL